MHFSCGICGIGSIGVMKSIFDLIQTESNVFHNRLCWPMGLRRGLGCPVKPRFNVRCSCGISDEICRNLVRLSEPSSATMRDPYLRWKRRIEIIRKSCMYRASSVNHSALYTDYQLCNVKRKTSMESLGPCLCHGRLHYRNRCASIQLHCSNR